MMMEQNSAELMRILLNSCDDLCYVKDINGIYLYVNDAYCKRISLTEEEILGKSDLALYDKEVANVLMANDQDIMRNKQAITVEEDGEYQGEYFCYKSNKTPLIDENGEVYGLSGVAFEYTETKLLENEKSELLTQLKTSNETLNDLFSVIAHDLKEPFNSLMTTSQLLIENYARINQNDTKEMLVDINSAAKSTYFLMNNLLAWSLQKMNNLEPTLEQGNINQLVDTCLSPYKLLLKNKAIKLKVTIPDDTFIQLDEAMIHIVLTNLINNAIKFSKTNGSIEVLVSKGSLGSSIEIKDNGVGIDEELLHDIFEVKQSSLGTSNEKGTGIGLNLCKKLIEQMDGVINITSQKGLGTTVKIILP